MLLHLVYLLLRKFWSKCLLEIICARLLDTLFTDSVMTSLKATRFEKVRFYCQVFVSETIIVQCIEWTHDIAEDSRVHNMHEISSKIKDPRKQYKILSLKSFRCCYEPTSQCQSTLCEDMINSVTGLKLDRHHISVAITSHCISAALLPDDVIT